MDTVHDTERDHAQAEREHAQSVREARALANAGQRRINLVWEGTQAFIAATIVLTTCLGIFFGRVINTDAVPFPAEWWTVVGLVIGFYFGRTNHARPTGTP